MEQSKLIIYLRKAKNGDDEAKTYLFNKNLPLIKSIINKFKNKIVSEETRRKLSEFAKTRTGSKNPNWKGGISLDKKQYKKIWNFKNMFIKK